MSLYLVFMFIYEGCIKSGRSIEEEDGNHFFSSPFYSASEIFFSVCQGNTYTFEITIDLNDTKPFLNSIMKLSLSK